MIQKQMKRYATWNTSSKISMIQSVSWLILNKGGKIITSQPKIIRVFLLYKILSSFRSGLFDSKWFIPPRTKPSRFPCLLIKRWFQWSPKVCSHYWVKLLNYFIFNLHCSIFSCPTLRCQAVLILSRITRPQANIFKPFNPCSTMRNLLWVNHSLQ